MATIDERYKNLSKFKPRPVIEVLDEENDVEYILTFIPSTNIMLVERSDARGEPLVAMSYSAFSSEERPFKLNKNNVLDRVIIFVLDAWHDMELEAKMGFFDSVPLNSLFIGRQYI